MKIKKAGILFLFVLLSIEIVRGIGPKIIQEYPNGISSEVMPWQIDNFDGWTFAATEDGLMQFDGSETMIFPFNNRRSLRSVNIDRTNHRIYAGGIHEFGYFYPSAENSLEYVCLSDSIGDLRFIGNIWGIYPHEGLLTVQGDNRILTYDMATGNVSTIESDAKLDCSAWINEVLWLGTDNGLRFLMGKNIVDAPGALELKDKRIRKILPYNDGLIIVASDGIWNYYGQTLVRLNQMDKVTERLREIFSADIKENLIALGSIDQGIGIADLRNGEYKIYKEHNGLPSNTVISVDFDDYGDLWTGLQFGMAKILITVPIETLTDSTFPIGSGYVLTLWGNKLYLGTNRGLYALDYKRNIDIRDLHLSSIDGLAGQVWGLRLIDDYLFCSHDRGLFLISYDGLIERIDGLNGVWDVQKVMAEPFYAYAGTYSGLNLLKYDSGKWVLEWPIGGYSTSMYNFVQESPNIIWNQNSESGIDRLTLDSDRKEIIKIENFKETHDGNPLTADVHLSKIDNDILFSTGNGIYIYDSKSGRIVKEREISRLLGNPSPVKRVKKTNGSIYALTDNELLQADPAGILPMERIVMDPLKAKPMYERDVLFPVDDYIGYPIREGYLFFDFAGKTEKKDEDISNFARINKVTVTKERDSILFKGNFTNLKNQPVLEYEENSIRVNFGSENALKYGVLYSTRLNDESWTTPSKTITKEFTGLKEGKYNFQVKAIGTDGRESSDSYVFRIKAPWWRTSWMIVVYIVISLMIIFAILRYVQIKISYRQAALIRAKDEELERNQEEYRKVSEMKDRQIMELEKEKLDKELRHKAQEVANAMISLSSKNESLQNVKQSLNEIMTMVPKNMPDLRKAILSLQSKVTVDIKKDDVLKRVEEEFDIVHDNFMTKLRGDYPDLTNNEVLLCAYIKMNLSTKEIAPMLNISVRGIETMRYRLRKKLGLDRVESLTEFLAR